MCKYFKAILFMILQNTCFRPLTATAGKETWSSDDEETPARGMLLLQLFQLSCHRMFKVAQPT